MMSQLKKDPRLSFQRALQVRMLRQSGMGANEVQHLNNA